MFTSKVSVDFSLSEEELKIIRKMVFERIVEAIRSFDWEKHVHKVLSLELGYLLQDTVSEVCIDDLIDTEELQKVLGKALADVFKTMLHKES